MRLTRLVGITVMLLMPAAFARAEAPPPAPTQIDIPPIPAPDAEDAKPAPAVIVTPVPDVLPPPESPAANAPATPPAPNTTPATPAASAPSAATPVTTTPGTAAPAPAMPAAAAPSVAAAPASATPANATTPTQIPAAGAPAAAPPTEVPAMAGAPVLAPDPDAADDSDDSDDSGNGDEGDEEGESHAAEAAGAMPDHYYTADLSDAELMKVWKQARARLGTISVGFTDAGRLFNAEPFPTNGPWVVVCPADAWATSETIDYLTTVIRAVDAQFPGGPPARVNHISGKEGGYLRPHRSHQTGRDVDLGFYYRSDPGPRAWNRARYMDLPRNWALIRDLVTMSDVQMILVDKKIQKVLRDYALSIGEDREWVDSLFRAGSDSLIKHARHHRDHFHVRFFNGRAQELGRRIQPLLAQDKTEHSIVQHLIRRGETLGHIAIHYGVPVAALRRANGLRTSFIRAGHILAIPVRGACVNCPVPPPCIVPPRRMPPPPTALSAAAASETHGTQ